MTDFTLTSISLNGKDITKNKMEITKDAYIFNVCTEPPIRYEDMHLHPKDRYCVKCGDKLPNGVNHQFYYHIKKCKGKPMKYNFYTGEKLFD